MATYRITAVPVYVNGHLYERPSDIGREIAAAAGLAGKALAEVEPEPAAKPAGKGGQAK